MAKYATIFALFAIFAVAMAATTVSKEAVEDGKKDLQAAPGIGLGYYGLGYGLGYGLYGGLYGHGLYGLHGLHGLYGFYGR